MYDAFGVQWVSAARQYALHVLYVPILQRNYVRKTYVHKYDLAHYTTVWLTTVSVSDQTFTPRGKSLLLKFFIEHLENFIFW